MDKTSFSPILFIVARDPLTPLVSIVASESAFSVGSRVLDECRSKLSSETLHSLMHLKDGKMLKAEYNKIGKMLQ